MKNFPHQISRQDRFIKDLAVFVALAQEDSDLYEETVVGDALARAGAYRFRNQTDAMDVEQLLAVEHAKPRGRRGTCTRAREMRRTFELLGLLAPEEGALRPTAEAIELLACSARGDSPASNAILRRAFQEVSLAGEHGTSHPYEIMLRLAGERPGLPTSLLGLALEAENDSEEEFQRLLELVDMGDTRRVWRRLGISEHQGANSVKVLAAVARQLGDLEFVTGRAYRSLSDPFVPRRDARPRSRGAVRSRRRRYVRDRDRGSRPGTGQHTVRLLDPDLSAARYRAHEDCLNAFAELFDESLDRWEGDFDLLVVGESVLLVEVKTIRDDARNQARLGLGQLLYYEHFDVKPDWQGRVVHRVLAVDRELDEELVRFLDAHEVGVVWRLCERGWGASARASRQLAEFGVEL